jgi:hypothetical protein
VRRIVNKKPAEHPALDALKNLPEEAKMKIYSDIYANPEYALLGYKGKHGFKGRVIDTGLVIMPYILSQEPKEPQKLTDEECRMLGKSRDEPLMFIPPEDILNDTDRYRDEFPQR